MVVNIRRCVFIASTAPQACDASVREFLSYCGEVVSVIQNNTPPGQPSSWQVEFATDDALNQAVLLNGKNFLDSSVQIMAAVNPLLVAGVAEGDPSTRTVHVAGINSRLGEGQVWQHFQTICGPITYVKMQGEEDKPSRTAYIEFATEEGMRRACEQNGAYFAERQLTVKMSNTPINRPGEGSSELVKQAQNVKDARQNEQLMIIAATIYASNIDSAANETELIGFFNRAGPVCHVKLAGDDRKPARFCFIEYMEPSGAFSCLTMLNGAVFRDKVIKIQQSTTPIIRPTPPGTAQEREQLKQLLERIERSKRAELTQGQGRGEEDEDRRRRRRRRSSSSDSYDRDRRRGRDRRGDDHRDRR